MSLENTINAEIKNAMLAKDSKKLLALRAVKSEIILAKTEKGGTAELSPETEQKILQKMVKQRKESAEIYKQQGRQDLYEQESFEAGVIEAFLPKQMSHDEIVEAVKSIISEMGVSSQKEMGKVMGVASKQLAGKCDNKTVSEIVRSLLQA